VPPKIIKGDVPADSQPTANPALADRKVIDRNVYSARQRSEEIKRVAEQQAGTRRQEGAQQAQQAYEQNFAAGSTQGTTDAGVLLVIAYLKRGDALRNAIDDCVAIGNHMCSKILGHAPRLGPKQAHTIAEGILAEAGYRRRLEIFTNPADHAGLKAQAPLLLAAVDKRPELLLKPDAATPAGATQLRSPLGDLGIPFAVFIATLRDMLAIPESAEPVDETSEDPNSSTKGTMSEAEMEPGARALSAAAAAAAEEEEEEQDVGSENTRQADDDIPEAEALDVVSTDVEVLAKTTVEDGASSDSSAELDADFSDYIVEDLESDDLEPYNQEPPDPELWSDDALEDTAAVTPPMRAAHADDVKTRHNSIAAERRKGGD
jgi:flagellar biosynthesis/type III secretory pathway protein FliH